MKASERQLKAVQRIGTSETIQRAINYVHRGESSQQDRSHFWARGKFTAGPPPARRELTDDKSQCRGPLMAAVLQIKGCGSWLQWWRSSLSGSITTLPVLVKNSSERALGQLADSSGARRLIIALVRSGKLRILMFVYSRDDAKPWNQVLRHSRSGIALWSTARIQNSCKMAAYQLHLPSWLANLGGSRAMNKCTVKSRL